MCRRWPASGAWRPWLRLPELLASEIATNAVLASEQLKTRADLAVVPVIKLRATSDGVCLIIHVWDGSDDMLVVKIFAVDEENGRGLFLRRHPRQGLGAVPKDRGEVVG